MAKEKCAGIIAYYYDLTTNQFKFLVAHPGGPFFKNVQKYGFPKGHIEDGEHVKDAAIREFKEETGIDVDYQRLGKCIENKCKKKNVFYFLYPMDEIWDLNDLYSNTFYSEYFKKEFPEIDDYKYVELTQLRELLFDQDKKMVDVIIENIETHI